MLAASPARDGSLELVRLTLQLLQSGSKDDISPSLKEYFDRVLGEAKNILDTPDRVGKDILPESIELALEMKLYARVNKSIKDVNKLDAITPEIANQLLINLESESVYVNQSSLAS